MDVLIRIKRLVLAGRTVFTRKAEEELFHDALTETEVLESVINAVCIRKSIRSRSPFRCARKELLHVIEGFTYGGVLV